MVHAPPPPWKKHLYHLLNTKIQALGSCDHASWAKCEEREIQLNSNLHSACILQRGNLQPLPTTSSRTSAEHHMQ